MFYVGSYPMEPWKETKYRGSYSPDIIAKKGKNRYVIEIKANTSNLSKFQKKALEIAPKYKLIPLLLKVKVTTKAEIVIKEI